MISFLRNARRTARNADMVIVIKGDRITFHPEGHPPFDNIEWVPGDARLDRLAASLTDGQRGKLRSLLLLAETSEHAGAHPLKHTMEAIGFLDLAIVKGRLMHPESPHMRAVDAARAMAAWLEMRATMKATKGGES